MGKQVTGINTQAETPAAKAERVEELVLHAQRGVRARGKGTYPPPGTVRMSQNIPSPLYEAFKMQAELEAATIRSLLVRAMTEYLRRKKAEGPVDLTPTPQYELPLRIEERSIEEALEKPRRRVDFDTGAE